MRWQNSILIVFMLLTGFCFTQATELDISGYADFMYEIKEGEEEDSFEIGQVELDIVAPLNEDIEIEVDIAHDPETESLAMAGMMMNFSLKNSFFPENSSISEFGIVLGQFDVPFGIDYNYYASPDRKLVSGPLPVEYMHDYWNDLGAQLYLNVSKFNIVLFGVNGFNYEKAYDNDDNFLGYNGFGYVPEDSSLIIEESESSMALGGRIGLLLTDNLEIGGSYATTSDEDNEINNTLIGGDIRFEFSGFSIHGEYLLNQMGRSDLYESIDNTGFYIEGSYEISNYFLVARQANFEVDINEVNALDQTSLGLGWRIHEGIEFRGEYQINSDNNDRFFAQAVIVF